MTNTNTNEMRWLKENAGARGAARSEWVRRFAAHVRVVVHESRLALAAHMAHVVDTLPTVEPLRVSN